MKKISFLLGIILLSTACTTTYFYSTLSPEESATIVKKLADGAFIVEDNLLQLTYSFNGKNAPVNVTVHNKSSEGMFIDWERSAFVVNDQATYYKSSATKDQEKESKGGFYSLAPVSANNITFLPPGAKAINTLPSLSGLNFSNINESRFSDSNMPDKNGYIHPVKKSEYKESDTPYKLRSYVTVYFKDKTDTHVLDQDFYISEIVKSNKIKPWTMPTDLAKKGDVFYTK